MQIDKICVGVTYQKNNFDKIFALVSGLGLLYFLLESIVKYTLLISLSTVSIR